MITTSQHTAFDLRQVQEALGNVRKALRDLGARDGEAPYTDVFKALRKADQLVADAMRRIDAGQHVSDEEYDAITHLFDEIDSAVLFKEQDQEATTWNPSRQLRWA